MKLKLAAVGILIILLVSGCVEKSEEKKMDEKEKAINLCIELCKNFKGNLSEGPCLSNNITDDWVCDVAHNPRIDMDNKPENQCSAFREGKAKHFVEVNTSCELIRAI